MIKHNGHTMEKKKEILKKNLEIPVEKWNGYEAELNGKKVIFNPTHTNYPKFFIIDGIEFYGEGVNEFNYKLESLLTQKKEKEEDVKINELHKLLFGGD